MIDSVFDIDDDSGNLKIVAAPLIEIAEFKKLFKKGAVGFMQMKYVWGRCDIKSPYSKMTDAEANERCIRFAGLEEDWTPDGDVKAAMKIYNETLFDMNPELKLLHELRVGLSMTSSIVNRLNRNIQEKLAKLDLAMENANASIEGIESTEKTMTELIGHINTLMGIAGKLETTLQTVNSLDEKVRATFESDDVRGSTAKGMFEDPEAVGHRV